MSDKINDGGPVHPYKKLLHMRAVPQNANDRNSPMMAEPVYEYQEGMSLRDRFAGDALIGLISAEPTIPSYNRNVGGLIADEIAREAYVMADSMIRAREKAYKSKYIRPFDNTDNHYKTDEGVQEKAQS